MERDPRFADREGRMANKVELHGLIEAWGASLTSDEAIAKLDAEGVPAGKIRHFGEALRDPIVLRRKEVVPLAHPKFGETAEVLGIGMPMKLSDSQVGLDGPPPLVGEHNDEIYAELGYTQSEIAELKSSGAI
jgi:crotonobetainyl-CoA:carnitine CoA-transferase CaiB-like acyl-CoA transferase